MIRKHFLLFLLLPMIISCGQMIHTGKQSCPQESITVIPVTPTLTFPTVLEPVPGEFAKIVILPFADYTSSYQYDLTQSGYWRRNVLIHESLQDEFYRFGFMAATMDDIIAYLFKSNIIVPAQTEAVEVPQSEATKALLYYLDYDNSKTAQNMLKQAIYKNVSRSTPQALYSEPDPILSRLVPLDKNQIKSIGSFFNAQYIVRGRIIEYGMEDADSLNPLQTGLLPFAFKVGTRTLFGFSKTDFYESLNGFAIGAALGQIGANNVTLVNSAQALNSFLWAGIGGTVALMASEGGKVPRTFVQIRLIVQNAKTGEIIWFNRVEVDATPENVYGVRNSRVLYSSAIQQAAKSLVENFVSTRVMGKRLYSGISSDANNYPAPDMPKSPIP